MLGQNCDVQLTCTWVRLFTVQTYLLKGVAVCGKTTLACAFAFMFTASRYFSVSVLKSIRAFPQFYVSLISLSAHAILVNESF